MKFSQQLASYRQIKRTHDNSKISITTIQEIELCRHFWKLHNKHLQNKDSRLWPNFRWIFFPAILNLSHYKNINYEFLLKEPTDIWLYLALLAALREYEAEPPQPKCLGTILCLISSRCPIASKHSWGAFTKEDSDMDVVEKGLRMWGDTVYPHPSTAKSTPYDEFQRSVFTYGLSLYAASTTQKGTQSEDAHRCRCLPTRPASNGWQAGWHGQGFANDAGDGRRLAGLWTSRHVPTNFSTHYDNCGTIVWWASACTHEEERK